MSMKIPFDNNSGERYTLEVFSEDVEVGNGVVLTLNKKACEALAELFTQLAKEQSGSHVHLGYDETEPQGPGFRLVLSEST